MWVQRKRAFKVQERTCGQECVRVLGLGRKISLDCYPGLVLGVNSRAACDNKSSIDHVNVELYPQLYIHSNTYTATVLCSAAHSPVSTRGLFHCSWLRQDKKACGCTETESLNDCSGVRHISWEVLKYKQKVVCSHLLSLQRDISLQKHSLLLPVLWLNKKFLVRYVVDIWV